MTTTSEACRLAEVLAARLVSKSDGLLNAARGEALGPEYGANVAGAGFLLGLAHALDAASEIGTEEGPDLRAYVGPIVDALAALQEDLSSYSVLLLNHATDDAAGRGNALAGAILQAVAAVAETFEQQMRVRFDLPAEETAAPNVANAPSFGLDPAMAAMIRKAWELYPDDDPVSRTYRQAFLAGADDQRARMAVEGHGHA